MPKDDKEVSGLGKGLASGLEIAAGVGLGVWVGGWWDRHHGSQPWGLVIGAAIGFIAGFYLLIRDSMRQDQKK